MLFKKEEKNQWYFTAEDKWVVGPKPGHTNLFLIAEQFDVVN